MKKHINDIMITIQTSQFVAQKKLIRLVTHQVQKLASVSNRVIEGRVYLKHEKSQTKENKVCELKLIMPGKELFATRHSITYEGAVLRAAEAVYAQLDRWKETHGGMKQRSERASADMDIVTP